MFYQQYKPSLYINLLKTKRISFIQDSVRTAR
jgi:hypothetical protein